MYSCTSMVKILAFLLIVGISTSSCIELHQKPIGKSKSISLESKPKYQLSSIEFEIHALVNEERAKNGLKPLKWNSEIAEVAREHSTYLAKENEPLTDFYLPCPMPFIHHEGFEFGLYHDERLKNRRIYYFASSGENIAIIPVSDNKTYEAEEPYICMQIPQPHSHELSKDTIEKELRKRAEEVKKQPRVTWIRVDWKTQEEIAKEVVRGWMNSPSHRKNILFPKYNEEGIGIAEVNDYIVVTQVLIERVNCGYENGPCCTEPGYYPYCYKPLKCIDGVCKAR